MDRDLYWAARSGNVSFLKKEEIKTRSLLSQVTPKGSSVLHIAAESNQLEFFQEAVRLCSPLLVKQANSKGDTPLHSAVRGGSTEIVRLIIKHAKELFSDIEQGHDVDGYKEVLRMENSDGDNALHLAARHIIKSDLAKLLLEADPQLSTILNSESHQSACFIALSKGNEDVAYVLLKSSNPSCSLRGEINGMTALHVATVGFFRGNGDILRKVVAAAPEMIKQGDDIGWTPVHYAASFDRNNLVELFLEKDKSAAYELELQDGVSALHIAATLGYDRTMKALVVGCPDCAELVDNRGRNALHAAVLAGQVDAVTFMLNCPGTLFSEADHDGNTPRQLAYLEGKEEIAEILTDKQRNPGTFFLDKDFLSRHDVPNLQKDAVKRLKDALVNEQPAAVPPQILDTDMDGASSSKDGGRAEDDYGYYQFSATLIATVTFTAAFTIPGGFIQSGSKDEGMAVLISKPAFRAFIIFDVLAFFASLSIVILLLFYKAADTTIKKLLIIYLSISYYGMALAFCCGLYVVLGNTVGFSIVVLVISVIGTLVAIFGSVTVGLRKLFYATVNGLIEAWAIFFIFICCKVL